MGVWIYEESIQGGEGVASFPGLPRLVLRFAFNIGRLSFHPIPCGSRDRPVGRKVIDESKIMCWHCACERQELCVPLDR